MNGASLILTLCADIGFGVDMILTFFTPVVTESGFLSSNHGVIANTYLKGQFMGAAFAAV